MTDRTQLMIGALCACTAMMGCRTSAHLVQEPRMDFDVSQSMGNRGYLVGTPPPLSAARRDTRQVMEAEVELPNFETGPAASSRPVALQEAASPEADVADQTAALPQEIPMTSGIEGQTFDKYVVKKGDTLWSIAADPKVLGEAGQWRAIFNANRDKLKSPDRVRKGMVLRIPRGAAPAQTAESSPATQYTK